MSTLDEAQFVKNEKPREYDVVIRIAGSIRFTVDADSVDEAKAEAEEMLANDEEMARELDDVDDVSICSVRKSPAMYLVTRDGKPMQVSRLNDGDLPRQPTERGF